MKTAALLLVAMIAGCTAAQQNALFDLDGTWTGQLKGFHAPRLSERPMDYDLWMTIHGDRVDLWFRWEGKWVPVWNGGRFFSVARHKSNAVIYGSNSKPQVECHWVETWSLTVSQFSAGSLETFFYRVVNNSGCPSAETQFAYGATGRLTRVSAAVKLPEPVGTYEK